MRSLICDMLGGVPTAGKQESYRSAVSESHLVLVALSRDNHDRGWAKKPRTAEIQASRPSWCGHPVSGDRDFTSGLAGVRAAAPDFGGNTGPEGAAQLNSRG